MATAKPAGSWPERSRRLAVELDERDEALRLAADDGDGEREPERRRAHDRLGRTADGDPHGQRILNRSGPDAARAVAPSGVLTR